MIEPSRLHSLKNDIIDKSVHTSNGLHIGNIHSIDDDSVVVKGDIVSTVYYYIPMKKVREWDGHALWLAMDDKESKKHILPSHSTEDSTNAGFLDLDLEEDILSRITQGAENHGISPTSYVNQIIKRYLEWDKFEPKADIVTISKPVAKELFGNLREEQIIAMAKNTAKNALQKSAIKFGSEQQQQTQKEVKESHNLDWNSFLSWLENEMNSYAIEIRHIVSKEGHDEIRSISDSSISSSNSRNNRTNDLRRHHKYILKHDIGKNYSLYFGTLMESVFSDAFQKRILIKTTSAMLTFEFEE